MLIFNASHFVFKFVLFYICIGLLIHFLPEIFYKMRNGILLNLYEKLYFSFL